MQGDIPPNLHAWANDARAKEIKPNDPQAENKVELRLAEVSIAEMMPQFFGVN